MPRAKSDKRTTLDKAISLRRLVEKAGTKKVVELAKMVEEEVEVLLKCQYEMRKTIKGGSYGRKTNVQKS